MTFAMRLGIHSQSGYGFYVKLTQMGIAMPLRETYLYQDFCELV
jgi:hypothetical protein